MTRHDPDWKTIELEARATLRKLARAGAPPPKDVHPDALVRDWAVAFALVAPGALLEAADRWLSTPRPARPVATSTRDQWWPAPVCLARLDPDGAGSRPPPAEPGAFWFPPAGVTLDGRGWSWFRALYLGAAREWDQCQHSALGGWRGAVEAAVRVNRVDVAWPTVPHETLSAKDLDPHARGRVPVWYPDGVRILAPWGWGRQGSEPTKTWDGPPLPFQPVPIRGLADSWKERSSA